MLLADQHLDAKIEINNPAIWEDEYYVRFLNNIGIYEENNEAIIGTEDDAGEGDIPDVHITVIDKITEEIIDQEEFSL